MWGSGACWWNHHWFQLQWDSHTQEKQIAIEELFLVAITATIGVTNGLEMGGVQQHVTTKWWWLGSYMVCIGSLFQFADGQQQSLTKAKFKSCSCPVGPTYQDFVGHSFRIGASTAAKAKAGIEDSVIRTLVHWNSSAFLVYIRTRKYSLAQISQTIAITYLAVVHCKQQHAIPSL